MIAMDFVVFACIAHLFMIPCMLFLDLSTCPPGFQSHSESVIWILYLLCNSVTTSIFLDPCKFIKLIVPFRPSCCQLLVLRSQLVCSLRPSCPLRLVLRLVLQGQVVRAFHLQ